MKRLGLASLNPTHINASWILSGNEFIVTVNEIPNGFLNVTFSWKSCSLLLEQSVRLNDLNDQFQQLSIRCRRGNSITCRRCYSLFSAFIIVYIILCFLPSIEYLMTHQIKPNDHLYIGLITWILSKRFQINDSADRWCFSNYVLTHCFIAANQRSLYTKCPGRY